jgi:hypothetical protein
MCNNKFIQTQEEMNHLIDETFRSGNFEDYEEAKLHAISKAAYFNADRDHRVQHIDLSTPCEFHNGQPWGGSVRQEAYDKLEQVTGFRKPRGRNWQAAHLCANSSTAPHACTNPQHIYWATAKENHHDKDPAGNPTGVHKTIEYNKVNKTGSWHNPKQRKKAQSLGGSAGSKAQLKAGTHNTQIKTHKCPYCFREFSATVQARHIASCARKAGHVGKDILPAILIHNPKPNKTRLTAQLQSHVSVQEKESA